MLFEQTNCEIPKAGASSPRTSSSASTSTARSTRPEREQSVRQLIHRVTRTIADWGTQDGYFATRRGRRAVLRELTWLCLHQYGSFNSPVWFNVGLFHHYGVAGRANNWRWDEETEHGRSGRRIAYEYPQGSACFIQSVADDMEDIMRLAHSEAMLFKFGSGTGTDLSTLRSQREKLSGGGKPSGPCQLHAGLRPDRRRGQVGRQDPPRRQDADRSRSGTPTSSSSSSARPRKRRRPAP